MKTHVAQYRRHVFFTGFSNPRQSFFFCAETVCINRLFTMLSNHVIVRTEKFHQRNGLKTCRRHVSFTPFRIPVNPLSKKKKSTEVLFFFWRRDGDSNPGYGDIRIHDFQSCSFGQLGHLCITTLNIIMKL